MNNRPQGEGFFVRLLIPTLLTVWSVSLFPGLFGIR